MRRPRRRVFALLVGLVILPLLVGCGSGIERIKMSGNVTYQGQPVQDGQIRFIPKVGTEMPLTVELIRGGQYSTSTSGGVPVGSYRVEIRAYHPDDPEPAGPGAPPRRQLLPPQYNSASQLEVTLASGTGSLTKDFDLR